MQQRHRRLLLVLAVAAVAWAALFYSARALLVWQWTDADAHRISCWYLAADGVTKRSHLYTASGVLGRSACPRVLDLDR